MERIWLKQYPQGIPADINVDQYSSIVQIFEESFKKFGSRPAYTCMDKTMTYADIVGKGANDWHEAFHN